MLLIAERDAKVAGGIGRNGARRERHGNAWRCGPGGTELQVVDELAAGVLGGVLDATDRRWADHASEDRAVTRGAGGDGGVPSRLPEVSNTEMSTV